MNAGFQWMPAQASSMASRIDTLFFSLLALTGTIALAIALLIVVFAIRYRHGSNADRSNPPTTARKIEIAWTVTPLLIFIGLFIWGAVLYDSLYQAPDNAMPVFVVGKQWMWKLQHANGRREIDELHVPLGQPVRLVMSTEDVIHSFYVPAFRIKQDVVPGRTTTIWFTPTALGEFRLHCAEYCGTDHARMGGRIIVMQPAEFQRWLAGTSGTPSMAARGFDLFRSLFTIGGMTGLFLAALALDVHLTDTYFVIAHFHYIMVSGSVMAYLGGIHFWWPKISGKMYPEIWGRIAAVIIFFGFNLTFFPQYLLGYLGMPRRYHSYPPEFQLLNILSSAGALILAVGYLLPLFYFGWSLFYGKRAGANPWDATGLEWKAASPPPTENFARTPTVTEEAYAYSPQKRAP